MRNVLILVDQRFYKYSWNLFLFRCARILLKKLISIYYYKIPRNLTKETLVFLMLVSAGETRRCNSHGNTGAPPLTAFPMIRNTADVDDRRRFTYDLHAVLWRSRPATLWSVANPPFNQRYIYQPFFENRSSIHSACRDLVTLLDYFLGKRHSPPGQSSSKTLMQNTVSIPTDKPKCLARVILSQNNLLLPPTQFDSNCKHHRHYFDSYLNLHFTWQTMEQFF